MILQSFKPSREYSRFLLYRGFYFVAALTNLATDLNILWKANPAVKYEVSSTLLVSPGCIGTTLSEALKCIKVKYWGDFLHIIILTKFQKNCSTFQNCDLRKFYDLPKIRNFCPPENVKFIFINKSFNFPHDWHRLSIWQSFRTNCSDKNFIMIASDR